MLRELNDEFKVSPPAVEQLANLVKSEDNADIKGIRIFVSGSGCSGIQYGMTFSDSEESGDGLMKFDDVNVYVDEQCLNTMEGIEIDFADGPNGPSFVFNNTKPAEDSGCGTCGSSAAAGGGCS